jgi:hypothetical protein
VSFSGHSGIWRSLIHQFPFNSRPAPFKCTIKPRDASSERLIKDMADLLVGYDQ